MDQRESHQKNHLLFVFFAALMPGLWTKRKGIIFKKNKVIKISQIQLLQVFIHFFIPFLYSLFNVFCCTFGYNFFWNGIYVQGIKSIRFSCTVFRISREFLCQIKRIQSTQSDIQYDTSYSVSSYFFIHFSVGNDLNHKTTVRGTNKVSMEW